MTERQAEVLSFIRGYLRRHGYPPTMREIAEGIGAANRTTAHSHVQSLVRDGHLERREHRGVNAYYPADRAAA